MSEQQKTEIQKSEELVKQYIVTSKRLRYQKQLETLLGSNLDRLMSETGLSQAVRQEVFTGNSTDKSVIFGVLLSGVNVTPQAKENFEKGITASTNDLIE